MVTRPQHRDEMVLKVELTDTHVEPIRLGTEKAQVSMPVEREKLMNALDKTFRDMCKVKFDRLEFVARGSIPEDAKHIIDKRKY